MKRHWSVAASMAEKKVTELRKAQSFPDENANFSNEKNFQCPQSSQEQEWPSTVPVSFGEYSVLLKIDYFVLVMFSWRFLDMYKNQMHCI